MEQKKIDEESGENLIIVYFYDCWASLENKMETVQANQVQKGDLINTILSMDEEILADCSCIELSAKYADDVVEDPSTDSLSLAAIIDFAVRNGELVIPLDFENSIRENGILKDGRYFSQEEFDQGRYVCIAPMEDVEDVNLSGEYVSWREKYSPTNRGTYIIDGKEYECIGHFLSFASIPIVPVTALDDHTFIMEMAFEFEHAISRSTYEAVSEALTSRYGENARVRELEIRQANFQRFNDTILIMMSIVMALSIIILSLLYSYVVCRREDCLRVYRLCGMTNDQVVSVVLNEAMIIILTALFAGGVIYHFLILPWMGQYFEYLKNSAYLSVYITIGILFIAISYFVLKTVIKIKLCSA